MIDIFLEVGTRSLDGVFKMERTNVEYRGMKISGVRVTKDLLIKNKAARALLKA